MMLRGIIDESYDGKAKVPRTFSLSCLVGDNGTWPFFEMDWLKVIDWKNAQLRTQARREITRYHASDCSSCKNEFADWTRDEQIELTGKLLDVFRKYGIHIYGYDMPLQLLVSEIPETKPNPVGFAYVMLLNMVMQDIGENTLTMYRDALISLHHDHCDYDAVMLATFNRLTNDESFKYRNRFTTITPTDWQHFVPLQPADLIAYENFKEGERLLDGRKRRKSLELILDLDSISGRAKGFNLASIRELKTIMDNMGEDAKRILLSNARIPYGKHPPALKKGTTASETPKSDRRDK